MWATSAASARRGNCWSARVGVPSELSVLTLLCIALAGCHSGPSQPTAAEISSLKVKCSEDGLGYSSQGGKIIAHYNEQTGRCYIEYIDSDGISKYVNDAETHKPLATILAGKSGDAPTGIVPSSNGDWNYSVDAARAKIKELMQEDAQ
jgi:hypothetical protein